MNHQLTHFETLDSTSTYIKDNYHALSDGDVIIAAHQTNGRGRLGRSWEDDDGSLLFSFLLKGNEYEKYLNSITLICGAAMELTFLDLKIPSKIKWPNDIYINDRKCAGILVEGIVINSLEALVIGIGININNSEFPKNLSKATSLFLETKKEYKKEEILTSFLIHFDKLLDEWKNNPSLVYKIIANNDYLLGKKISLNYYNENKKVACLGIDETFALKVIDEEGNISLVTAGEATINK